MDCKILAVDFDGTLCENNWPGIGEPNHDMIDYLKLRKQDGTKLILWTCRIGEKLKLAVEWCKKQGLEFDAINENLPEAIELFGSDTRKVFAHEYIDDRMSKPFNFPSTKEISLTPTKNLLTKEEINALLDNLSPHHLP